MRWNPPHDSTADLLTHKAAIDETQLAVEATAAAIVEPLLDFHLDGHRLVVRQRSRTS